MGSVWLISALWMGLAVLASLLAIWSGISASLLEVLLGSVAASTVGLKSTPWADYLAGLGAILLAFLAGSEVKFAAIREFMFPSLLIGAGAFLGPFLAVLVFAKFVLGWTLTQALIGAIALSTTSVALVYAVLLEEGMSRTHVGQIVLASRFVNDICTVLALYIIAVDYDYRIILFLGSMVVAILALPLLMKWFIPRIPDKNRMSEPDVRLLAAILFLLGGLASISGTEAVVSSYLIGVSLAPTLEANPRLGDRLQTVTFAWFAPFYFLRAGSFVEFPQEISVIVLAAVLAVIKLGAKCAAIVPLAAACHIPDRERWSIALLMATGLTFGTIAAYIGAEHGIISRSQYTMLVLAVIASGLIPIFVLNKISR